MPSSPASARHASASPPHRLRPWGLKSTGDPSCTAHASYLGIPAVSLPVLSDEGLPLGLQVAGFVNGDANAVASAAAIAGLF